MAEVEREQTGAGVADFSSRGRLHLNSQVENKSLGPRCGAANQRRPRWPAFRSPHAPLTSPVATPQRQGSCVPPSKNQPPRPPRFRRCKSRFCDDNPFPATACASIVSWPPSFPVSPAIAANWVAITTRFRFYKAIVKPRPARCPPAVRCYPAVNKASTRRNATVAN